MATRKLNIEITESRRGSGFSSAADDADRLSRSADDAGGGLNKFGDAADTADTRAMGFRDSLTGVQDTLRGTSMLAEGPSFEGFLTLGMGIGDLGSGIYNFVVPALGRLRTGLISSATSAVSSAATHVSAAATTVAGWVTMGVQATINAVKMAAAWVISLGPVALVIAAVAAVIAILVSLGVGFDDIKRFAKAAWDFILGAAQAVFGWLRDNWPLVLAILTGPFGLAVLAIVRNWNTIKEKAGAVLGWIKDRVLDAKDYVLGKFQDVADFLTGLPSTVADAFSGLGSTIIDGIKSLWNSTVGGFGFDTPSWIPGVGGRSFRIPELAEGGIVRAQPGGILANIGEGRFDEAVVPLRPGMGLGGPTITVNVSGSIISERDLVKIIRDEITRRGFGGLR